MRVPVSIGVVGLDRTGPALARQFEDLPQTELRWLCDPSPALRLRSKVRHREAQVTSSVDDLLQDETLDAIAIAAAPATHYALVREALYADKHVLVEPPLALTGEQADDLVRRSETQDRRLMVGELALFQPAIRKLKELIQLAHLGEIYYVHATWAGCGLAGVDGGLWDLMGGGVSVLLHLLGDQPIEVAGRSESYLEPGSLDVAFCFLRFATGIGAHVETAQVDVGNPRRLSVIGSERIAVVDGEQPINKLTLYEKSRSSAQPAFRVGDVVSPELAPDEPARAQCERFIAAVRAGVPPLATGREGAAAVHVLNALERSLQGEGQTETVRKESVDEPRVVELPTG